MTFERVVFTRVSPKTLRVDGYAAGAVIWSKTFRESSEKVHKELMDAMGVTLDALLSIFRGVRVGSETALTFTEGHLTPTSPQLPRVTVSLRGIHQPAAQALWFEGEPRTAFDKALSVTNYPASEPVMGWGSTECIAALDVDYHSDARRSDVWLESLVAGLAPRPAYSWITHGKGVRGIYFAAGGFTAGELAACAAVTVKQRDPNVEAEVKAQTRHPAYRRGDAVCGPVLTHEQTTDLAGIRSLLTREVNEDQIDAWLEEKGLTYGQTYSHDRCPVGAVVSESHGEPVFVGDGGIHCHYCAAKGLQLGSRKPGFFPYSALIPGGLSPLIRKLVTRLCHWTHARHVLAAEVGLSGDLARQVYSALLKIHHGDDPRVPAVFDSRWGMIRLSGRWATEDASASYGKDITHMLAKLPATQFVTVDGEVKVDRAAVNLFQQTGDITEWGYPALTPVRGLPIYGRFLPYGDVGRINLTVQNVELRREEYSRHRPRYVRGGDVEAAWRTVEGVFPGVDRDYLTLLLAARGVSEGNVGICPMILTFGPSASAKSSSVTLAATIAGDHNTEVGYNTDVQRFRQAVMEGIDAGSYVTFNEVLKDGRAAKRSPRATLDVVLNLTPDSVSHKMYLGPVALGRLPVLTFTDVEVPQEVADDTQLARRFVIVQTHQRKSWEDSLRDTGVHQIRRFRVADVKYADAANVILSHVIDTYFQQPRDLKEIATMLGYYTLENSPHHERLETGLRHFFDEVCAAPPLSGADAERWPGRGWKLISRQMETPLARRWERLCDEDSWSSSRKCGAVDWAAVLGVPRAEFDYRAHGNRLVVRFRVGEWETPEKVNEEIHATRNEPRSPPGGAVRLGDTECGGFETGWGAALCGGGEHTFIIPGVPY